MAIATLKRHISAAILTPVGRGAVATIRVAGELSDLDRRSNVLFLAANERSLSQQPIGRIAFGHWSPDQFAGEDVVVCRTRPDVLEIHCHGGDAAVRRILADLNQAGCAIVDWHQQQAGTTGELEAECADMLSRASTWRTAEILHEQSAGLLRRAVEELRILAATPGQSSSALVQLDALLEWHEFGKHLSQPWTAVLTGRPNVGKSSLINALLGYQRAIVFDQPGTTRDVVTAETAFDGWPVLLADTAGLREATEELEAAGIALARERLEHTDARLVLVDLSQPPTDDDATLIARWPDAIIVGHKCDLADQWHDRLPTRALRVSSVTGQGVDEIQRRLMDQLIPRVPPPGTPIPITQRQASLLVSARNELDTGNASAAETMFEQFLCGTKLPAGPRRC